MNAIESIQLNTTSLHERELTVTVSPELVNQEFTNTLNNIQRVAQHKGFRPGKMPRSMVLSFYDAEIREKLIEKLYQKSFNSACEKEDIIPVSPPKWSPLGEVVQAQPFTYKAVFQVKPKISSPEYKGLKIELKKVCFDEADVDDEIKDIQASMATFVETNERSEIKESDLVECDYVVKVDGIINPKLGHTDYSVPLFAEHVPQNVKDALIGKKISQMASIQYTMPANDQDAEIAGKSCEMLLTIKSFKERILPKIDDELAKDVSEKFDTLENLKESIRLRFKMIAARRDEYYRQEAISRAFVEKNPLEIPDALVGRVALSLVNRELETMGKKTAQELTKNHWAELWQSVQGRAQFRAKAELLMEALIKELDIAVTEDDILDKVERIKDISKEDAEYSLKVDKLLTIMEKEGNLSTLEEPLFKAGH